MIVGRITRAGEQGKHLKKSRTIKVSVMEHEAIIATLLHEMAHASVGDAHGERFCKEMERLASMGAPIHKDEPRQYREIIGAKLNQRYFRAWADDAFADVSHGLSFRSF